MDSTASKFAISQVFLSSKYVVFILGVGNQAITEKKNTFRIFDFIIKIIKLKVIV